MKKTYLLAGLLCLMTAGVSSEAQAQVQACRDYTNSISINGRLEIGFAQACRQNYNRWNITQMSGPVETYQRLQEMIYSDLRYVDPGAVIVNNIVVNPQPQTRVIYQQVPVYYKPYNYYSKYPKGYQVNYNKHNRHHDRHDHHDNRHDDYRGHNDRDDYRGKNNRWD